jgi:hypothetical protein
MRFTVLAFAALFFTGALADCHNEGDDCNDSKNHGEVKCECAEGQEPYRVREIISALTLISC